MARLCKFNIEQIRTGTHPAVRALDHAGVNGFYNGLINLSQDDILNLVVPIHRGYQKGTGPIAPYNNLATDPCPNQAPLAVETPLNRNDARQLCILLAFFHFCSNQKGEKVDIMRMKTEAYDMFRMSIYSPGSEIIPYGVTAMKTKDNEVVNWSKIIKADEKHYKEFRDEANWIPYKKHMTATLKSHGLSHMIDPNHHPTNEVLHIKQSAWLYKVFQDNFKQITCRSIVTSHELDQN
jgi:hypothetical protein